MLDFYKHEITPGEYKPYFSGYIDLTSKESFPVQMEKNTGLVRDLYERMNENKLSYRYAESKWTLAEVIGHMLDTERIMCYRALRIARGDKTPLPGFEQDDYVLNGPFARYRKDDILMEYTAVRLATATFFEYLSREELASTGVVDMHPVSVRAIAFIILGHELHHYNIIIEKYLVKK